MTDLSREAVQQILDRAEVATAGPWRRYDHGGPWTIWQDDGRGEAPVAEALGDEADAEFIAHARSDVPVLARALLEAWDREEELAHALSMWVKDHNRADAAEARVAELEAALEVSVPLAELECIGGFDKTNPRYLYDEPEAWDVGVVPVYRRVAAPVTPEQEGTQ